MPQPAIPSGADRPGPTARLHRRPTLGTVIAVRTCVGCRGRDDKSNLVRLTAVDGAVRVDPRRTAAGRGAYLHRDRDCWEQAQRKRALSRVLRTPAVDREQLLAAWQQLMADAGGA